MTISIKRALPEDIEFLKQLEIECSLAEWSRQDYISETIRKESIFLIALNNTKKAGFILARLIPSSEHNYEKEIVEIYNIAVATSSRRKGIGKVLLQELSRIASNKGAGSIHLEVRRSNHNALNFYKKNGFIITGERKNFYANPTEDALLMKLRLS